MDKRNYEMGIIIQAELNDDSVAKLLDTLTEHIKAQDGSVEKVDAWGRRPLAYQIEDNRDGYYAFFDILLPPQAPPEIERLLRINEDVLRYILIRAEE